MEGVLIIYLGIDYITGTLVDDAGNDIITIRKPINLYIREQYVEQDPEEWNTAIVEIINEIQNSLDTMMPGSITITYQPGTFVCIDRSGKALMNAILRCDNRARYQVHICNKNYKKHGGSFNISWNHMILPRLLWIKYNKPDIYNNIFKVLTPDGYIAYRLCGEAAVDNYSAVFLGYNMHSGSYEKKLIKNLGLDIRMLPEVKRIGDCIGIVSGGMEDIVLKSEIKFIISTNSLVPLLYRAATGSSIVFDTESSDICFGMNSVRAEREKALIVLPVKGLTACGIMGNYEMQFLKMLDGMFISGNDDQSSYTPGSNGVLILPFVLGDSTFFSSDIKGCILGITGKTNDMVTAVYESVGYIIRENMEYISDINRPIQSIEVLSHTEDKLFYRILSNITGMKVLALNRQKEFIRSIMGLIFNTGFEQQEFLHMVNPDGDDVIKYRQLFSLYKSAYDSMKDIFRYRSRIIKKISP